MTNNVIFMAKRW